MNFKTILRTRQFNNYTSLTHWLTLAAGVIDLGVFALRKTFTVVTFNSLHRWDIEYKSSQVLLPIFRYGVTKRIGIKGISRARLQPDFLTILLGTGIAAMVFLLLKFLLLTGIGILPVSNGLLLSLVASWIIEFSDELRLCFLFATTIVLSFLIISGVLSSADLHCSRWRIAPEWVPALAVNLFISVILWGRQTPRVSAPSVRGYKPGLARYLRHFFHLKASWPSEYTLTSLLGSIRRNITLGITDKAGKRARQFLVAFTTGVSMLLTLLSDGMFLVQSNKAAFGMNLFSSISGTQLISVASWFFQNELPSLLLWIMLVGSGVYLIYVSFNGILYDRFIVLGEEKAATNVLFFTRPFVDNSEEVSISSFKNVSHLDWFGSRMYTGFHQSFIRFLYLHSISTDFFSLILFLFNNIAN